MAALSQLLDVALKLSSEHQEDRILELVTQGVCAAIPCERASLFLLDEVRQELYTRTVTQLELNEIRISQDRGIIGWVARERQVCCVDDPSRDSRWDSSIDQKTGFVTRNILAVPVLSLTDDRLLGVLQVMNTRQARFELFDSQVAQAFAAHAATALERSRFQEASRREAELRREMELARRVQRSFLPDSLPEVAGYRVAAWWQPAEFVSGDYYDWFPLADGRLGLVVGDVCGHGIGPSLIMASVRAMLRVLAKTNCDPESMLSLLAKTVSDDLKDTQFVTLLIAALDPATNSLKFANAGHGPALLVERRRQSATRLESTQLPLGFPRLPTTAKPGDITLGPGDLLLLGTDGIVEARNADHELFGSQRLISLAMDSPQQTAQQLVAAISRAVAEFQGHANFADDATLVVVERTG